VLRVGSHCLAVAAHGDDHQNVAAHGDDHQNAAVCGRG
jgi:hypothetical protein